MADDDVADDDTGRPSLEAPQLFKRRRRPAAEAREPEQTSLLAQFDDAGHEPDDTTPLAAEAEADTDAAPSRRRTASLPSLPSLARWSGEPPVTGALAAALVGVVVGFSLLGFTWLGFRGCEAARGTSSCGTGPGMAALIVVLVLSVVVGAFLLRWVQVPDPSATSFLGTGLTGVVCLLFLVDQLDHWSMIVVIPAVTAVTFLASWWVTTTYVAPE